MKAQSSIEFVTLFTLVMLLFLGGLYFTGQKLVQIEEERIQKNSNAISNILQSEIELASKSEGNYSRVFSMPTLFRNDNYSLDVYDNFELTIDYNGRNYVYPLKQSVVYFNVHPGEDNIISHINDTVFIGNDAVISVDPSNTVLGVPEGSTITIRATVASIFGGVSSVMRILEEPPCIDDPPGNECSNLLPGSEYIVMDQIDFINFSTNLQINDFGIYKFTINGTTLFGSLISPIEDHNEEYYWLELLNVPPVHEDYIEPADNSVYELPKSFAPLFYSVFHDDNADLADVYLEFTESPVGPYTVDPVPDIDDWQDHFPPENYDFTFNQDVPLPDFGNYVFTFRAVDSQGLTVNTPLRTVELRNIDPVVTGVYSTGDVPLPEIISWSDELNYDTFSVEVEASDINWNLKNISLVFTDFVNLDRPSNLQNIVVNNLALENTPDSINNPGGESFRAVFNSGNGLVFDAYGQFFFKFVATDILGLTHESGIYQVNTYPPPHYDENSITPADGTVFELYEGFETDFNVTFYDDFEGGYEYGLLNYTNLEFISKPSGSGITGAEFTFDPVSEYVFSVKKALDKFGSYNYRFTGMNVYGGVNTTEAVTASLVNVPPIIQGAYESISYVNPPISGFSDPHPARIPYDPNNIIGYGGDPDIFYLYVTDANRNLEKTKLVLDTAPLGAPGKTVSFTVPQSGSGVYWADFTDFAFTDFGIYSFHFEAEDEYGLTDTLAQFELNLINEHPYFLDLVFCPTGICYGTNDPVAIATEYTPVLNSQTPFGWGFDVQGADINWNLKSALVDFFGGVFHNDVSSTFPDNEGSGYSSFGTLDFDMNFYEFGTYDFKVILDDDEGLTTVSNDYSLTLVNAVPELWEVCPYGSGLNIDCNTELYNPAPDPALFIYENVGSGSTYTLSFDVGASDVNHNLDRLEMIVNAKPGGSSVSNQNYDPMGPYQTLTYTFNVELDVIGDYVLNFKAVDEEGEVHSWQVTIMLQNPPPEFVSETLSPNDGVTLNYGQTIGFGATATDLACDLDYIQVIFTSGPATIDGDNVVDDNFPGQACEFTWDKSITLPTLSYGTYTYHFKAVDSLGQYAITPDRQLHVMNQAPQITSVTWSQPPGTYDVPLPFVTTATISVSDPNLNVESVCLSGNFTGCNNPTPPTSSSFSRQITASFNSFGANTVIAAVADTLDLYDTSNPYNFSLQNTNPFKQANSEYPVNWQTLTKSVAGNGYNFEITFEDNNDNMNSIVMSQITGAGNTISGHTSNFDQTGQKTYTRTIDTANLGGYFGDYSYSYTAYDAAGGSGGSGTLHFHYVDDTPSISVNCPFSLNDQVSTSSHTCTVSKTDTYNSDGGGGGFTGDSCSLEEVSSPGDVSFYTESSDCTFNFNFAFGCGGHEFTFRVVDNEVRETLSEEYSILYTTAEICDNLDNDCDGSVDEGCDDDTDNYCDSSMTVIGTPSTCTASPQGSPMDCDDTKSDVYPGHVEECDGYDNDCNAGNGYDTEGSGGAQPCTEYYKDQDNDGYTLNDMRCYCGPTGHYTETYSSMSGSPGADCCDIRSNAYPGQTNKYSYSLPSTSGCPGTYDWNCDGVITKDLTRTGRNPCGSSSGCSTTPHWNENSVPSCGQTRTKATYCSDPAWNSCYYTTSEQAQTCN